MDDGEHRRFSCCSFDPTSSDRPLLCLSYAGQSQNLRLTSYSHNA